MERPLFKPGRTIGTAAAVEAMQEAKQDPNELLLRHVTGDWGEISQDVRTENEVSVRRVFTTQRPRIFSAYTLETGVEIWLFTEADRSVTTYLLPEEYINADTQSVGPMIYLGGGATRDLNSEEQS
jgi:hypothetical protein